MKRIIYLTTIFLLMNYLKADAQLTKVWESDTVFRGPESVAYDAVRNCLYVGNLNTNPRNGMTYNEDFVSKTDLDGKIIELEFVKNLTGPTGICVAQNRLYIVERFGVVVFNLSENRVETRYRINEPRFLNDISVDDMGNIYVSVSDSDVIYRISGRKVEQWLTGKEIDKTNGVLADGDKLIVGVNSDSTLKAVNIADKKITTIAQLPKGIIDGIKKHKKGYLVSYFEGSLYLVENTGKYTELLNTRNEKINCADFEYIEEKGLVIIPALRNNKVFMYILE
ncbi:MAG: hypothetical protein JXB00_20180 [Bacteroidales bacterium]|nr:hypothetical protein [Bacteroidales bacterium]